MLADLGQTQRRGSAECEAAGLAAGDSPGAHARLSPERGPAGTPVARAAMRMAADSSATLLFGPSPARLPGVLALTPSKEP